MIEPSKEGIIHIFLKHDAFTLPSENNIQESKSPEP